MADPDRPMVYRNHNTTLAAQLGGLCVGLQVAAASSQPVGKLTTDFLRRVLADCRQHWQGQFIDNVPELNEDAGIGDFIVLAESLKAVAYAFLSPDDFEEVHGRTGFGLSPKQRQ